MRVVVLVLALLVVGGPTRAEAQSRKPPIRVYVECAGEIRTKACPAFLQGFIDAHPVLAISPRAGADVLVFLTGNEVAQTDQYQLRFVGRLPGAPEVIEQTVNVDVRKTDDEQRALIQPVFLRGIALFVAARFPAAVTVQLGKPNDLAPAEAVGSPWGIGLFVNGNASHTGEYQSANSSTDLVGRWLTARTRALALASFNAGLTRQPPLELDDGTIVPLDAHQWSFRAGSELVHLLSPRWSTGISSYTKFDDPRGQFEYSNRSRAAIEWDAFPSNDPRGNRLGIFYHLGWITERYNIRNELGEKFATYPVHGINAVGSFRHDKMELGISLESEIQVLHPNRRRNITASPFIDVQLGDHVALGINLTITQRALPAPDPNAIDPSDYQLLSRLSYAEPLSISGGISLEIRWDPTNGIRNNRLESI
ncbi:MAG: hypothetical protein SFX73_41020 [Kofleriaceae bacterium]|nr:hypothetical protein [Kofleriaceae bacterium]